ncbi:MAG: PaaI family thioesterase [Candidatus Eisenbacteria bacterium]|nr:PaaI family thioesterase [Candidatus Eisenbacteria bacterium]
MIPPSGFEDDDMCFACGKHNSDGLGMEFDFTGDEVRTSVVFPKKFQGYRDVVHGGLVSTALDEAMVTLLNKLGYLALTAELTVRFVRPVRVEERLDITARLIEKRGKIFRLEAEAVSPDGSEVARASSRCFILDALPQSARTDL